MVNKMLYVCFIELKLGEIYDWTFISLSMLVYLIGGIDMKIYVFLKNVSTAQPDNNIFLQHAAIRFIATMLLTP